ncbi:uncharacterized protein [Tenebrio molitor]|uniref:uncharacterized protein isoform X3 n=1 Tax=Tenebrio molitor TaxID=7067 RepID=UPI0036246ECC
MIIKVFRGISKDFAELTKTAQMEKTADYTGCGYRTIQRYLAEEKKCGQLQAPKKPDRKCIIQLDEHQKYLVRKTVHSFFSANKIPTIDAVYREVQKNEEIPNISRFKLYNVLHKLKFKHGKRNRKSLLIERQDIITWRRRYLREIKKIRQEGRPIFYLDETWLNAGHTKQKIWYDETIKNSREAFNQGLSTGLKSPSGKGKRLIILHIGSEDGFVDDGLLLFEGIKQGDYHDEMNANKFEEWFTNILTKLPANSVIVMDNASYHSRALAKVLPEHWKNNIEHVKKVESQMWEIDNLTDSTIEEIIINIVSDSSSIEWSDDEKEN